MADKKRTILVCSCEDTMALDGAALAKACRGATLATAHQLCRAELARFRAAAAAGGALTVACTQEAPLFGEVAGETPGAAAVSFVNIRETAGWSRDGAAAGPKIAALLAAAEPAPDVPFVSLTSEGVILILGRDAAALEAAALLKDHLDVTVMLTGAEPVAPPRTTDFPVFKGTARQASGHLGAFALVIDGHAAPHPSGRDALAFGAGKDGVAWRCDIVLDLSGAPALFNAADLRDGYLRADPRDGAAVLRAVLKARDLVGSFDKPRYIAFTDDLCAHARSRIVGCRRCLDLCPTGAITPAGDHVAIDAAVCAGCGQCAAACPTGAAAYALPPVDALIGRLRTLLAVYRDAGGTQPVVLLHDGEHGGALIDALARFGDGLPANALPVAINETTQVGLETIAAAFAYGAAAVRILTRARPRHDATGLAQTIALADALLAGLGFGAGRVAALETDDPDALGAALRAIPAVAPLPRVATFAPLGAKRGVQRLALRELQRVAPAPVDVIALPAGAPFGTVTLKVDGCTLCLACVAACPTGALSDDPDRPMLRFTEDACVQCGLCRATCPESVIGLRPQLDFRDAAASPRVLKEEEPFACIRCGKPFGVRATIERVTAKLAGRHWMFQGAPQRLDVLKMCEDCRVITVTEQDFDPHAPPRPTVRTTEDYLRERDEKPED
jgi:ferredoxin